MKNYKAIMDQFKLIENSKPEDKDVTCKNISNRIKILIKNMFTNAASGWEKTKKLNETGPKTKADVQKEVQ